MAGPVARDFQESTKSIEEFSATRNIHAARALVENYLGVTQSPLSLYNSSGITITGHRCLPTLSTFFHGARYTGRVFACLIAIIPALHACKHWQRKNFGNNVLNVEKLIRLRYREYSSFVLFNICKCIALYITSFQKCQNSFRQLSSFYFPFALTL